MSDKYAFRDLHLKLKVNTKKKTKQKKHTYTRKICFKVCGNMNGSILTRQRKKILTFLIE